MIKFINGYAEYGSIPAVFNGASNEKEPGAIARGEMYLLAAAIAAVVFI